MNLFQKRLKIEFFLSIQRILLKKKIKIIIFSVCFFNFVVFVDIHFQKKITQNLHPISFTIKKQQNLKNKIDFMRTPEPPTFKTDIKSFSPKKWKEYYNASELYPCKSNKNFFRLKLA